MPYTRMVLEDLVTVQKLSSRCSELGGPSEKAGQWLDLICTPDQSWHNTIDAIHFAESNCDSCAAPQGVQLHFACDMCQGTHRRAFATRLGLVQHQRAVHGVRNEARRYVKADGVCPVCQIDFRQRFRCIRHLSGQELLVLALWPHGAAQTDKSPAAGAPSAFLWPARRARRAMARAADRGRLEAALAQVAFLENELAAREASHAAALQLSRDHGSLDPQPDVQLLGEITARLAMAVPRERSTATRRCRQPTDASLGMPSVGVPGAEAGTGASVAAAAPAHEQSDEQSGLGSHGSRGGSWRLDGGRAPTRSNGARWSKAGPLFDTPPLTSSGEAVVVWLHGFGDTGEQWSRTAPALQQMGLPMLRFLFPTAPVRSTGVGSRGPCRSWYDVESLNPDEIAQQQGRAHAAPSLPCSCERRAAARHVCVRGRCRASPSQRSGGR
ncbi:unnamed protein product, partial [Prorocentrum cordatum]